MRQSVLAIKDLANRAGQGISMDPERMGESLLQECENGLNVFWHKSPKRCKKSTRSGISQNTANGFTL